MNDNNNLPEYQDLKPLILKKRVDTSGSVFNVGMQHVAHAKKFDVLDGNDPDPPKKPSFNFVQQLQKARVDKKMDRKTLAGKLNVTENVIASIENGKIRPERALLDRINRVLGVTLKL